MFSNFATKPNLDEGNCIKFDPRNPQLDTDFEAQLNHLTSEAVLNHAIGQVHEAVVRVRIIVKDVNDNAPLFVNTTIYGEVQENGPIDLSVVKVKAYDADDIESGTNALLTYSIEKNVVDEETGDPLFTINPENGALKTAVCCLDRETTPEYNLQVVASDGGGLKGTGTVIVRLSDLNDNSPRLSRRQWDISVDESDESLPFEPETILEMTADDPDTSNYFLFRIVPGSGNGWQKFGLRTKGNVGAVYAASKLDYEDEKQRRGLRFLVEVTDRGPGGWDDRRHVDSAWVSVTLRDINDNPPSFEKSFANVSVSEDAPTGLVLEKFKATDPDEGENGQITYRLSDTSGSLEIDEEGIVRIKRPLDREGPAGTNGTIIIIASDKGDPPKTSQAILYIDIKDVNDTPPRLLPPTVLHVQENLPPKMIGTLIATDDDVWSLGHGPPFKMRVSDLSTEFVVKRISLRFRPDFDDGNGGAEIWTKVPLDREECPEMTLKVALSDAGGVTTVVDVTIIVDDVNDNPMKPGSKTVFLWKTMGSSSEAPLGRIYVDDLDDWDGADKSYQWADTPHPLFALDQKTGDVFAAGQVREGRYDLFFNVSDSLWGQKNISARVTVIVRLLSSEALSHAVPITLSPVTAANLTYNWIPTKGGGRLGLLTSLVENILHESVSDIKIVSVYDSTEKNTPSTTETLNSKLQNLHSVISHDMRYSFGTSNRFLSSPKSITRKRGYQSYNTNLPYNKDEESSYYDEEEYFSKVFLTPSSCVWMSAKDKEGGYMDVVKLRGLLELNLQKIEEKINLTIQLGTFEELTQNIEENFSFPNSPSLSSVSSTHSPSLSTSSSSFLSSLSPSSATADPSAAASIASISLPLQVVDSNTTALVTPRLSSVNRCLPSLPLSSSSTLSCAHSNCLNGGKCIPKDQGSRCICPGNTDGPLCIIKSRSFSTGSWIWLKPLPSCLPLEFSFRFLTQYPDGILLYSGPLSSQGFFNSNRLSTSSMLIIQLRDGRPQIIVKSFRSVINLTVNTVRTLNDGEWHNIHVIINNQGVKIMVDYCISEIEDTRKKFSHCISYASWPQEVRGKLWGSLSPLQLGGTANKPPIISSSNSNINILHQSLKGCISNLVIGNEIIDLGEPKYSYNSHPSCYIQNRACTDLANGCDGKGTCKGGLGSKAFCSCATEWTGAKCEEPLKPVAIGPKGFIKLALSFTPDPLRITFSVKVRTRLKNGIILKLSSQHNFASLTLKVANGEPCLVYRSRSQNEKKSTTVSIVGITSTSSVKALNLSNTFYIKNWNHYELDKFNLSKPIVAKKIKKPSTDSLFSTLSVCISKTIISDGVWYRIKGGRFGYNLLLEISNEDLLLRNETLRTLEIHKRSFSDKIKSKMREERDLPEKFVIDAREGISVGNFEEITESQKDENFESPNICIVDFRISGRQLPLPPTRNGSRWAQVAASGGIKMGCSSKTICQSDSCPSGLYCRDDWIKTSCGCPPHHILSQHGCRPFDVCLFRPCLNNGFCDKDQNSFKCSCLPQFNGEYCQWKTSNGGRNPFLGPIVLGVSVAAFLMLALLFLFICRKLYYRRRSRRRKEGSSEGEKSLSTEGEASDYISLEIQERQPSQTSLESFVKEKKRKVESTSEMKKKKGNRKDEKERKRRKEVSKLIAQEAPQKVGELLAVLLPKDDLRAYAYEGEGSSQGSLGSAISEMRKDINRETEESISVPPYFGEVVDLLRNIPDASLHYPKSEDEEFTDDEKLSQNEQRVSCQKVRKKRNAKKEKKKHSEKTKSFEGELKIIETSVNNSSDDVTCKKETKSKHSFIRKSTSSSFWYSPNRTERFSPDVSVISSCSADGSDVYSSNASLNKNSTQTKMNSRPSTIERSRSQLKSLKEKDSLQDKPKISEIQSLNLCETNKKIQRINTSDVSLHV